MATWKMRISTGEAKVMVGDETIGTVHRIKRQNREDTWVARHPNGSDAQLLKKKIEVRTRSDAARLLYAAWHQLRRSSP